MFKALYESIRKDAAPVVIEVDGRKYTSKEVYPCAEKLPVPLTVQTLTGFVDYVRRFNKLDNVFAHIVSPVEVRFLSSLSLDGFNSRDCYIIAKLEQLQIPLNTYIEAEKFNIMLQACFFDSPENLTDRNVVLRYSSNVVCTAEAQVADDGVTQAVTVRKGVAGRDVSALPNRVKLAPYRTFTEIAQPASEFVFRCKTDDGDIKFMLAEADGGAWRGDAMRKIKEYLTKEIPNISVIA